MQFFRKRIYLLTQGCKIIYFLDCDPSSLYLDGCTFFSSKTFPLKYFNINLVLLYILICSYWSLKNVFFYFLRIFAIKIFVFNHAIIFFISLYYFYDILNFSDHLLKNIPFMNVIVKHFFNFLISPTIQFCH